MEAAITSLENNTQEALVITVVPECRDLTRFCSALQRCRRLRRLGLRGLRTRPAAVQEIMAALADNSTLEVLDLSFNELGDACVKTVIVALTMGDARGAGGAASGLHTLMLDSNSLDDSGAGVLALLGLQHRLRKVSLRGNRLGDRAALLLAGALPGKSMLEEIDLRDNDIGTNGAEQLVAMIDRGRGSLRSIHLQGNPRMASAKLQEVEAKVNQPPRTPSPRKSPAVREKIDDTPSPKKSAAVREKIDDTLSPKKSAAVRESRASSSDVREESEVREKGDGATLAPDDAGQALNDFCSRVQNALSTACLQAQKQERQMQFHASVLGELTRDVEDGLADLLHIRSDADAGASVQEHSFSHAFDKAREESMRRSVHKTLQLASEEVSAAAREMRVMHSQLNFEQSQAGTRLMALQQYLSFRNSISWQKLSPGNLRSHEQRLYAREADLIGRQEVVDNLHRELRLKTDDLVEREQRLHAMMNTHASAMRLDAERKAAVVLQQEQQLVRSSEEAIKLQQERLHDKSAYQQQLQQRLLKTEEALRTQTLELAELEAELRGNAHKLLAAEQLVKTKMDQAADEHAQARAKSLSAQAMMEELEEMLVALEGKELSGTARRHARTLQLEAAARFDGVHNRFTGNGAAVGAVRPMPILRKSLEMNWVPGSGADEGHSARDTLAPASIRDKELVAVSALRTELEASQRDLEASRVEVADRLKETSALRTELDALLADVKDRAHKVEQGAQTIEDVLALLESTSASHQLLQPVPVSSKVGDCYARDFEGNGEAEIRSLSQMLPKTISSTPAETMSGAEAGATWAQRAGNIRSAFENLVATLKASEEQHLTKDKEWGQTLSSLRLQVSERDEEIRQLRYHESERRDTEQTEREREREREQEMRRERELEWERDKANSEKARHEADLRERDMQLEHAQRENELLRRISSLEAEMAALAAQLESERRELANKQRDLEKERAAAQLEMAVREKALQSLVDEQTAELLQQSQSLQRDVQSLRHQQQLTEERELALQEREIRFGTQETVLADLQARSAQLGEMEERLMSEVRLRDEVEAEWQRLALTQQGIEQHKERLLLREERLNLRIQEHEKQVQEWTKSCETHQRRASQKLDEREKQVALREKAIAERETQLQKMKSALDLSQKQMESFDAMATFREKELQRREVELDEKEANVREAETVIAYLEKELGNTEEDMARIQQEVRLLVKSLNERHGKEASERQKGHERELDIAARERAVEVREREQVRKEKELQEVQMLAERYANALEIKKREVAMSQLELQMKLTEMGLVQ